MDKETMKEYPFTPADPSPGSAAQEGAPAYPFKAVIAYRVCPFPEQRPDQAADGYILQSGRVFMRRKILFYKRDLDPIEKLAGKTFGRWLVLDSCIAAPDGRRKWLCRCACGTERYVLERSLRYGGSCSCGCLRRENLRKAVSLDLTGRTFGDLTVLYRVEPDAQNQGVRWVCQCACGNTCTYPATLLAAGKRISCGCKRRRSYAFQDITGRRFHRLTALYPLPQRDKKGSVIWRCRCDCGNEIDVSYNNLAYSNMKSCGCQKKEHNQALNTFLSHVAGTSVNILKSKKTPSHNTTGVKGVYLTRGKYVAKIVFQKKQYYLGTYSALSDAAAARRKAEAVINDEVILFYEKWLRKAESEPDWAKNNPIQIKVEKYDDGLRITFTPTLL